MTPEELFNKTAANFLSRWTVVSSFRSVAIAGLPHAERVVAEESAVFVGLLNTDPTLKKVIVPGPVSPDLAQTLARAMTTNKMATAKASIDAASLVFAHAVLDEAAFGYCRVAAAADPADWEAKLIGKKVTYSDLKAKGAAGVLNELIKERIQQLERESLPSKIQTLLSCCRPPTGFKPLDGYDFSLQRIEALDQLRHDVVHDRALGAPIVGADADLEFLMKTASYLVLLLNHRYDLKFDLRLQAEALGMPRASAAG